MNKHPWCRITTHQFFKRNKPRTLIYQAVSPTVTVIETANEILFAHYTHVDLTWTRAKFANEDRLRLLALAFSDGVVAGLANHLPLLDAFATGHRTLPHTHDKKLIKNVLENEGMIYVTVRSRQPQSGSTKDSNKRLARVSKTAHCVLYCMSVFMLYHNKHIQLLPYFYVFRLGIRSLFSVLFLQEIKSSCFGHSTENYAVIKTQMSWLCPWLC